MDIRLSVVPAICLSVDLDAPQPAQKSQQRQRWQQVSPLLLMTLLFWFAYVGEVAALHLGRQGETSLARASPLPETVLGGWCEFCLEERRIKRRMAPVHAQHHKPNPLLPAVDLQLEADSWCLVGVVCCICHHVFSTFYSHTAFPLFFPIWIWVHLSWLFLLERWKRVIKEVFFCWESILRFDNVVWLLRACKWLNFLDTPLAPLMEYCPDSLRVHLIWVWRGYDCGRKTSLWQVNVMGLCTVLFDGKSLVFCLFMNVAWTLWASEC